MSIIQKIFHRRGQILLITLVVGVPIWFNLPGMTEDMAVRPLYYLWSKGLFPLNQTIRNDFMRDSEYRTKLSGQPVDILQPIFPQFTRSSDYNFDSDRYKYSQKIALRYQEDGYSITIDDIYWLIGGEHDDYGIFVATSDGNIIEFGFPKG